MAIQETESRWEPVRQMMENAKPVTLGPVHTQQVRQNPQQLLYTTSYYKFAAKIIGQNKSVLDLVCNEGLGTWILAKECSTAKGIDPNQELIDVATKNWPEPNISFSCNDALEKTEHPFGAVVNFDTLHHIQPSDTENYIKEITSQLTPYGIAIIGVPNNNPEENSNDVSFFNHESLKSEMLKSFTQVLLFSANDEIVQPGQMKNCQYLIAVGIKKK